MGCRAELLMPVVSTSAVLGLVVTCPMLCSSAEARGDSTGAALGLMTCPLSSTTVARWFRLCSSSFSCSRCRPVSQWVVGGVSVRLFPVQVEGPVSQCEVGRFFCTVIPVSCCSPVSQ